MENKGNLVRCRFDFMNASKAAHELLERKRPPVLADGHDLRVENERVTLEISARNLHDFRQARSDFGKAPAPDAHLISFFMNLDPSPVVLELERCLSFVSREDFVEILRKLGQHGEQRN